MKRTIPILSTAFAHDEGITATDSNLWNQAREPTNWWNVIKQVHGHVGPWNVLGWRIGKTALRELHAQWGLHQLDLLCHIPIQTPYSCLADGLIIGTGNSLGRLDIRLSEVMAMREIYVGVRRKDGTGPVLLLKPNQNYLKRICHAPDAQLDSLAHQCAELPEKELFVIERIPPFETN